MLFSLLICLLRPLNQLDSMSYPKTETIGNTLAKAINPKPSSSGLRPGIELANPRPRAATTGTVTVEVVTPPVS